jgi:2,5-diamino-6-(ribosylamino)-4(3H)-pyrimidinone 5'-phosphate reductase
MAPSNASVVMRPHIVVNCAMTADGKIASIARRQVRISSPEDLERVKALRAGSDAILVGVGTVLADDPHLTVKSLPPEKNPLRIVLDSQGRTPNDAKVLAGGVPTLIATTNHCTRTWKGAQVLRCGARQVDLHCLMDELERRGIERLLVEGGGETIWSFFKSDLVDEYRVFIGSLILGGKDAPTPCEGVGFQEVDAAHLRLVSITALGEGAVLCYEVVRNAAQST